MNALAEDQYVEQILTKYAVSTGPQSPPALVANAIAPIVRNWAGTQLVDLSFSGSYAKGTPVHGGTDVDLFISLAANTTESLKDIYNSLFNVASRNGWSPRRQDVSVGISYASLSVDLVPGKVQSGYQNYHSLYRSKKDSWTQTNVSLHINTVGSSGRTKEIRALKIWRNLHRIDLASFFLELAVIEALKGRSTSDLAANVLHTLRYLGANFPTMRIIDPANSNNIISADYSVSEKAAIAQQANSSAGQTQWGSILW